MKQKLKIDLNEDNLLFGDCKDWLPFIPSSSIDLIYIDPPFFSNKNYEVIWGNGYELRSFGDRWKGGINHYIGWMRERLIDAHRVLKPTGSMLLHCDWRASHHLRLLLDELFGYKNFVNEIIWSYHRWTGKTKSFQKNHNTIYVYCREKKHYIFNDLKEDYSKKSKHKSPRFSTIENGKINQTYVNGERKKSMRDVWDISYLNSQSKERIGYRTQKPEALLERIIQAFSNKHDTILDFMGGGQLLPA